MFRLPSEKEEHKTTIGALILSIFIIIAGIGGMIYTKHESSEFKNSTDVRTLHATGDIGDNITSVMMIPAGIIISIFLIYEIFGKSKEKEQEEQ